MITNLEPLPSPPHIAAQAFQETLYGMSTEKIGHHVVHSQELEKQK